MRRINQLYLLATQTHVNVSGVKVPETINDEYFRRAKAPKAKKSNDAGDIFTSKKEEYKPSDQRKTDQAAVDKMVLEAVKKHPEGASLKSYLKCVFILSKGQYPHKMAF
jgi:large subunit ribosomal protein L6e